MCGFEYIFPKHSEMQHCERRSFRDFLSENGVPASAYEVDPLSMRRFVRLRSCSEEEQQGILAQLEKELGEVTVEKVSWLPGFYSLPGDTTIAQRTAYQNGDIYGIEASSGAAVFALDPKPGQSVLDLCCAPGAKLCMLADLMQRTGALVGVDVATERLNTCRTVALKYHLLEGQPEHPEAWRFRLFQSDGRQFSLSPHCKLIPPEVTDILDSSRCTDNTTQSTSAEIVARGGGSTRTVPKKQIPRRRRNKSARAREAKRMREQRDAYARHKEAEDVGSVQSEEQTQDQEGRGEQGQEEAAVVVRHRDLYDRVLLDAECTHDGSLKHVVKFDKWGWDTFETRFLNPARLSSLKGLQCALLVNAFGLLKVGGVLVYSTCSLCRAQNEEVVAYLLQVSPSAKLVPVFPFAEQVDVGKDAQIPYREGLLKNTVRFDPSSGTSGLFIAKITKTSLANEKKDKNETPATSGSCWSGET